MFPVPVGGGGIEFASVRQFAPGDDVRRLNWSVSSRRGDLYVNVHHPERNAEVVLLLDSFADVGQAGSSSLDVTVRAAFELCRHYLDRKDRVGLVGMGGVLRWLTPAMGRTQFLRIADYLLETRAVFSYAWRDTSYLPKRTLPAGSLVIALTPLADSRVVRSLVDLRSRGFALVVLDTLTEAAIAPGPTPEQLLSHRLWLLQRAATRGAGRSRRTYSATRVEEPGHRARTDGFLGASRPADRESRVRRVLAWVVALAAVLLGAYPLVIELQTAVVVLGFTGVLGVGAGLRLEHRGLAWMGVCILALEYSVALVVRGGQVDVLAPVVGTAVLLLFELTDLALFARGRPIDPATLRRSMSHVLAVTGVGGLAAVLAVGLRSSVSLGYPIALVIGGVLGVLALILPLRLALRVSSPTPERVSEPSDPR